MSFAPSSSSSPSLPPHPSNATAAVSGGGKEKEEEEGKPARTHRFVLPLPAKYAVNALSADPAYSSFTAVDADNSQSEPPRSSQREPLDAYLDDLCAFLQDYRLVQYHPEHYFHYVLGSSWLETSTHRDGSPVTQRDVDTILRLCRAFIPFFDRGEDGEARVAPSSSTSANLDAIHHMIMQGPRYVASAATHTSTDSGSTKPKEIVCDPFLVEYYDKTKEMMMCRQRRPLNDSASLTLLREDHSSATSCGGPSASPAASKETKVSEDVLDQLLDYGMGPKKQHEVEVMRTTMYDLVSNCCHDGSENAVHTIMNIGEGKGYVSRVMAMNDGFQVIGLDCNPHHKEKQLERTEFLLEGRLGRRTQTGEIKLVNLLYRPRGRMVSVACRVGPHADWQSILSGHVALSVDGTTRVIPAKDSLNDDTNADDGDGVDFDAKEEDSDASVYDSPTTSAPSLGMREKVECRLCGQILRRTGAAVLVRHTQGHFRRDHPNEPLIAYKKGSDAQEQKDPNGCETGVDSTHASLPSTQEVLDWVKELSSKEYAQRVISTFFSSDVRFKKTRSGELIAPASDDAAELRVKDNRKAVYHLTRGMRIRIRLDREIFVNLFEENPGDADKVVLEATVLGFDFAADKYKLLFDGSNKRMMVRLVHPEVEDAGELPPVMKCNIEALLSRAASTFPAKKMPPLCGAVLHIFPFPKELSWPVKVPSLANTAMMGLHPCGDLGANVCRIFLSSRSSALLLVSCCWHALTNDAFPLSNAFRSRGLRTESLSLTLATQPLDMWATASAQGHRGSVRILFQRSMLHYLWFQLKERYTEELRNEGTAPSEGLGTSRSHTCTRDKQYCCPFATLPHLEPCFLRRVNKVKTTITFTEFLQCVVHEYLSVGVEDGESISVRSSVLPDLVPTPRSEAALPAKSADHAHLKEEQSAPREGPKTEWNYWKDQCPACRRRQLQFLVSPLVNSLADAMYAPAELEHFKPFVGFTVLRIWASHLVETILLLDRALYLHEELHAQGESNSSVSLVPLFDGALSPRMYGVLAARQ